MTAGDNDRTAQNIVQSRIAVPARYGKVLLVLPFEEDDLTRINSTNRVIAVDMPTTQSAHALEWSDHRTSVNALGRSPVASSLRGRASRPLAKREGIHTRRRDRGGVFPYGTGVPALRSIATAYTHQGSGAEHLHAHGCGTPCAHGGNTNQPTYTNMSRTSVLVALAAGAALGAIAGILFAPASGKETRGKLMKQGAKLRDQLADLVDQGKELMDDAKGQMKDAANQAGSKMHDAANQARSSQSSSQSGARSGATV